MADNTPSSGSYIRPYRVPWGAFVTKGYTVNANSTASTISVGQIVQASTLGSTASGRIELASSLSTAIVGVAGSSKSTVALGMSVYEANPMAEFKGFAKGTLSDTQVGRSFSYAYDSSLGIHYIDLANSSAADVRVLITGLIDATGDTNGEVSFRFRTTDGLATSTGQGYVLAYYR